MVEYFETQKNELHIKFDTTLFQNRLVAMRNATEKKQRLEEKKRQKAIVDAEMNLASDQTLTRDFIKLEIEKEVSKRLLLISTNQSKKGQPALKRPQNPAKTGKRKDGRGNHSNPVKPDEESPKGDSKKSSTATIKKPVPPRRK